MADRIPPARNLPRPFNQPPMSWLVQLGFWIVASKTRVVVTVAAHLLLIAVAAYMEVSHG